MCMPSRHNTLGIFFLFALFGSAHAASADGPRLGQPASPASIAAWNLTVYPDGQGLPAGRGTATEGKAIYDQQCSSCHGPKGQGGSADELAGGSRDALKGVHPDKTIGSYWPYATTVFDFIRRSMPLDKPGSLSNDQLYAVTAYLLHLNRLWDEHTELTATTLPKVAMPNRDGFVWVDVTR